VAGFLVNLPFQIAVSLRAGAVSGRHETARALLEKPRERKYGHR
jgi:hypothetical protein